MLSPAKPSLRDEFVARQADGVKNQYIWALGWRAFVGFAIFSAIYFYVRNSSLALDPGNILYRYHNFLALAAGACVGTWLSFSIRRVELAFEDLSLLERDRLRPSVRLLFVIGLTAVIGLFIQSKVVGFLIGSTFLQLE